MEYLTKEEFAERARMAVPLRPLEMPGVGIVAVQAMTGTDLDEYITETEGDLGQWDFVLIIRKWIARLVCEGDRSPLFDGAEDKTLDALPVGTLLKFGVNVVEIATGQEVGESAEGKAGPVLSIGVASGG